MDGLSILMPVYNERGTVEAAIADALEAELPVASRQLVVVDDGSTDGTRELLASHDWPDNVRIVVHDRNRGQGSRCADGARATQNGRSLPSSMPISSITPPI